VLNKASKGKEILMSARIHFSEHDFARPADPDVAIRDAFGNELSVREEEALWRVRIEFRGAFAFTMRPMIFHAERLATALLDEADQAERLEDAPPRGRRRSFSLCLSRGPWWRRHRLLVGHDLVWGVVLECRGVDGFRITMPPEWARVLGLEILRAARSAAEATIDPRREQRGKDLAPRPDVGRLMIERIFLGHNSVHRKVAIGMRSGGAEYTGFVSPAEARRIGMDVFIQADKAEGKKPN
jgi:hypothetical protein